MFLCIVPCAYASVCARPCENGGVCTNGRCVCPLGFIGRSCSRRGCSSNCSGRGYCDLSSKPASCLCFPGFTGRTCESTVAAAPVLSDAAKQAIEKSSAVPAAPVKQPKRKHAPAKPKAESTATKVKKLRKDRGLCTPECASTGFCFNGACLCENGYTGPTCALRLCPRDCSARGSCDQATGVCDCYAPYSGKMCEIATKPIKARKPDTIDDVDGPPNKNDLPNQLWEDKKGLSDSFHLIEMNAAAAAPEQQQ